MGNAGQGISQGGFLVSIAQRGEKLLEEAKARLSILGRHLGFDGRGNYPSCRSRTHSQHSSQELPSRRLLQLSGLRPPRDGNDLGHNCKPTELPSFRNYRRRDTYARHGRLCCSHH